MPKRLALIVAALMMAGCPDDNDPPGPGPGPSATVSSVTVSGAQPSVARGGTVQFTATANLSNNTTQNVSSTASWSSSDANVATVSSTGLATALAVGTVDIRASHQGVTGSAQLQVSSPATASFIVQSVPDNVIDTCRLVSGGDLNCSFIGTASSSTAGAIVQWTWRFFVGPFQREVTDTDPFLDPQAECGLFNVAQTPAAGPNFVQMIVELRVRDAAGNDSAVARNPNVRLFPQNNCGFAF